ncbi:hypothetical protein AB0M12_40220 [Nocardia vinacea]|uniref:hypothetical protein n=1 Tax=Nocardia vinacea TaxID=96468 RepID=UPI003414F927
MSLEEIRKKVLATALEAFDQDGLPGNLGHLNMNEIFRRACVSRASAKRIWPTTESFYPDLMEAMVDPDRIDRAVFDRESIELADAVAAEHWGLTGTAEGRREVLREAIRQGVEHNFESTCRSLSWRTYAVLTAALPALTDQEHHKKAHTVLATADARYIERMAAFYRTMMAALKLRFKPEFDENIFAGAAAGLIGGMVIRQVLNQTAIEKVRLAGIDGEPVEWHPAAIGFLALIDGMTEPDLE